MEQALALSQGGNVSSNEPAASSSSNVPSGNTIETSRATVAGLNEGDEDEEMTEEDAIARAIEMSLMDSKENSEKQ